MLALPSKLLRRLWCQPLGTIRWSLLTPLGSLLPTRGECPTLCCSSRQWGGFFPHPTLFASAATRNTSFLWGLPIIQTPLVDAANSKTNQGQVPEDTPDAEDDYRGPRLHFQIPAQTTQAASASQFPTIPFGYPGATSMPILTYAPTNPAL